MTGDRVWRRTSHESLSTIFLKVKNYLLAFCIEGSAADPAKQVEIKIGPGGSHDSARRFPFIAPEHGAEQVKEAGYGQDPEKPVGAVPERQKKDDPAAERNQAARKFAPKPRHDTDEDEGQAKESDLDVPGLGQRVGYAPTDGDGEDKKYEEQPNHPSRPAEEDG